MSQKKLIAFIILINYFQHEVHCFVDYNAVQTPDPLLVIHKNVAAKTNYKLTWINFTNDDNFSSAQLVVSLPPELRHMQQLGQYTRHRVDVSGNSASFRIREASRMHEGFYTAFRLITDYNNTFHQYVDERKDFYIHIKGLSIANEDCSEDSACESNYCLNNRCVCGGDRLVWANHKCYSAAPIGGKCFHSSQCQFSAGSNAECSHKGKCRCIKNAFPIDVPLSPRYCVGPKVLNDNCTYSEECRVIESNRYCSERFRCECIPHYYHNIGIGCLMAVNNMSTLLPKSALISTLLLLLTFMAKSYL